MADLYRKKPVVIEALHWDGRASAATVVIDWMLANGGTARYRDDRSPGGLNLSIDTIEGTMAASPGDWIIKGVKGEFYPCRADIFEATYERVSSHETSDHGQ